MRISTEILPQLSPHAAKLYLILHTLAQSDQPVASAPISTLSQLAQLSERTCWRALQQLQSLQLIQRLPRTYHGHNSYSLVPPQSHAPATVPHQSHDCITNLPPQSHETANHVPPQSHAHTTVPRQSHVRPTTMPPQSHDRPATPRHAPKTPSLSAQAQLLNKLLDPRSPLACEDPQLLAALFHQLSDAEKQFAIAKAQATLAGVPA